MGNAYLMPEYTISARFFSALQTPPYKTTTVLTFIYIMDSPFVMISVSVIEIDTRIENKNIRC